MEVGVYVIIFTRSGDARRRSYARSVRDCEKIFINGASFELVRESVSILSDEELQKIYDEVMMETK